MEKSAFYDLYPPEEAFVMEQRAKLLMELETWLKESGLSQKQAAERLGVDQPRVSDIKNGMTGYVIVRAESHADAAKLFENHPHFTIFPGDSVEIMECLPLPDSATRAA